MANHCTLLYLLPLPSPGVYFCKLVLFLPSNIRVSRLTFLLFVTQPESALQVNTVHLDRSSDDCARRNASPRFFHGRPNSAISMAMPAENRHPCPSELMRDKTINFRRLQNGTSALDTMRSASFKTTQFPFVVPHPTSTLSSAKFAPRHSAPCP
jgi:hypothetical protein